MIYFLLTVHVLLCTLLVILVMLQQGKGADVGVAFGGGGANTLFGAGGANVFLVRVTTGVAIAFMLTSILLVRAYNSQALLGASGVADPLRGSVVEKLKTEKPVAPPAAEGASAVVPPAVVPPVSENAAASTATTSALPQAQPQ